eukprot:1986348-Prorocentrum_lima.AAC.1
MTSSLVGSEMCIRDRSVQLAGPTEGLVQRGHAVARYVLSMSSSLSVKISFTKDCCGQQVKQA